MTTLKKQVAELTNRVLILEKMVAYILYTEPREDDGEIDIPYPDPFAPPDPDPLFDEAWQTISKVGKASTSYLQRRLSLGYNRAARLMDALEKAGIVSEALGVEPRKVLKLYNK